MVLPQLSSDKLTYEKKLWDAGITLVAGVDEAGRGAWAGPVCAAAVVLKPYEVIPQINDSKKLSPKKREELFDVIISKALCYGISLIDAQIIDSINILQASLLAMKNALEQMTPKPQHVLVDGNMAPNIDMAHTTIIDGDALSQTIGAASILAKVTRDRLMRELHGQFPQYQFDSHKGYGTKAHQKALAEHGVTILHRKSFEPIRVLLK
ncbi:ribonuclease HII [bacterium]|nr:ribonuclease HII [bacterium]